MALTRNGLKKFKWRGRLAIGAILMVWGGKNLFFPYADAPKLSDPGGTTYFLGSIAFLLGGVWLVVKEMKSRRKQAREAQSAGATTVPGNVGGPPLG